MSEPLLRLLSPTPLLDFEHPSIEALIELRGRRELVIFDRIGAAYDFGCNVDEPYLGALRPQFPGVGRICRFGVATLDLADPHVEWIGEDTFIQKEGIADDFDISDDFCARLGSNLSGAKRCPYEHVVHHSMNRNVARIRAAGS